MNLLSKKQKMILGKMARKAWLYLDTRERAYACEKIRERLGDPFISEPSCFKVWKHDVQREACPRLPTGSACEATQDDWRKLKAAWLHRIGRDGEAFNDLMSGDAEDEKRRRAAWLLEKSCRERGLAFPEYPEAICRKQFRVPLAQASAGQLRNLMFTVRNRRRKQTGKVEA